MNRKLILTVCLSLLGVLLNGCRDEMENVLPGNQPAGSIVLTISTESKLTRTTLTGSDDLHHVREVYAVLYRGSGNAATYVCHQILTNPDGTPWNPMAEMGDNGQTQAKEFTLKSPIALSNGAYTLLCIGLDDQSGLVYGLTLDAATTPAFCGEGKTLSEAIAQLQAGRKMTNSELFAGWETFNYNYNATNPVNVDMRRRIAGVYAYLKDIPVLIDGKTVETLSLELGNLPNSQISLVRDNRSPESADWNDYGNTLQTDENSKILATLDMTAIADPNTETGLYMIKKEYTDATPGISPHSVIMGAYILPQQINQLYVKAKGAGGELIKAFPVVLETKTDIDFRPNHVYHVGTRDINNNLPATLAGDRLKLTVEPWRGVGYPTEFPTVPLNATIKYDKNYLRYIYDCINTTDSISIVPSFSKKNWSLDIVGVSKEGKTIACDWLYFEVVNKDGSVSYTQKIVSDTVNNKPSEEIKVKIRMNDYVVQKYWTWGNGIYLHKDSIMNDWRKARIVLTTDGMSATDSLPIRQFNAIPVQRTDGEHVGFSRYDFGAVRDVDGVVVGNGKGFKGSWGYTGTPFITVYNHETSDKIQDDGHFCYERINKWYKAWGPDDAPLSAQPAVRYSYYPAYEYRESDKSNAVEADFWYLPARDELYKFFSDVVVRVPEFELVETDGFYWSATAARVEGTTHRSYCQQLLPNGKLWDSRNDGIEWCREKRDQLGYARRARYYVKQTTK